MAIVADLATFRVLFPEFASVPDATVTLWLDDTDSTLSDTAWGDCRDKAILYYVAHIIALSQNAQSEATTDPGGNVQTASRSGPISSSSAGGLSVSFASNSSASSGSENDAWLQQTNYGQTYATLKRKCLPAGGIAGCLVPRLPQLTQIG